MAVGFLGMTGVTFLVNRPFRIHYNLTMTGVTFLVNRPFRIHYNLAIVIPSGYSQNRCLPQTPAACPERQEGRNLSFMRILRVANGRVKGKIPRSEDCARNDKCEFLGNLSGVLRLWFSRNDNLRVKL